MPSCFAYFTMMSAADTLEPCAATRAEQTEKLERHAEEHAVAALLPCPPDLASAARARATLFIKRNPSALAEAALAESDPAAYLELTRRATSTPNDGARYGTWWHEFVELLEWQDDPAAWDATLHEALDDSPDPALSQKEWTLLRDQLTAETDLARLLRKPGAIAHAETPFLWAMNERECLEGIIDLAIFDPAAGSWMILDWKTNRTTEAGLAELYKHYLPQLSAYWQAVSQMLGAPVRAGLYSTATARWLPYETGALAAAWHSLEHHPAAIASALAKQ